MNYIHIEKEKFDIVKISLFTGYMIACFNHEIADVWLIT